MASAGREIRGFQDLVVWRRAMDLVVEAYSVTKSFPVEERYGLTAQLRRAAVSVPSNTLRGGVDSASAVFSTTSQSLLVR
jgi:four helix bundle protein